MAEGLAAHSYCRATGTTSSHAALAHTRLLWDRRIAARERGPAQVARLLSTGGPAGLLAAQLSSWYDGLRDWLRQ